MKFRPISVFFFFISLTLVLSLVSCSPSEIKTTEVAEETAIIIDQPESLTAKAPSAEPATTIAPESTDQTDALPTGELKIAHGEILDSLDPQAFAQIYALNISLLLYDPLVRIDDDGQVVPVLATSWEQQDDFTWKINLQPDVLFQDGEKFTCDSVKFTLDRVVSPEAKSALAGIWGDYDHTDCVDDITAVVVTKKPMGTFLSNLALTVMLPANAGADFDFSTQANGTGPYKLISWSHDADLVLEANAEYWGELAKTKTVVFKNIPDVTTRVAAFETGEVDFIWGLPPEEAARLSDVEGLEVITHPTFYLRFLWMNAGVEPFNNEKVRDAMRYAIDVNSIIGALFPNQALPATGCIAQGVLGYCKQPEYPYDPEKAKSLLAESGYPEGFDTEIKFATHLPRQKELAETLAAYLGEIGINVSLIQQDQSLWVQDLLAMNWQLNLAGTTTITGDGDFTLSRIYMSTAKRTGYDNLEIDNLLADQQQSVDLSQREEMMCQVCNILWDDGPTIWLFNSLHSYGIHDYVKGYEPKTNQFIYVAQIYIDK